MNIQNTHFNCLDDESIEVNWQMLPKVQELELIIFEWSVNAAGREAIIKWHLLFQKKKEKIKELPHPQETPWCWPIENYPTSCHQPLGFIYFRMTYYWLLVRLYGRD